MLEVRRVSELRVSVIPPAKLSSRSGEFAMTRKLLLGAAAALLLLGTQTACDKDLLDLVRFAGFGSGNVGSLYSQPGYPGYPTFWGDGECPNSPTGAPSGWCTLPTGTIVYGADGAPWRVDHHRSGPPTLSGPLAQYGPYRP